MLLNIEYHCMPLSKISLGEILVFVSILSSSRVNWGYTLVLSSFKKFKLKLDVGFYISLKPWMLDCSVGGVQSLHISGLLRVSDNR